MVARLSPLVAADSLCALPLLQLTDICGESAGAAQVKRFYFLFLLNDAVQLITYRLLFSQFLVKQPYLRANLRTPLSARGVCLLLQLRYLLLDGQLLLRLLHDSGLSAGAACVGLRWVIGAGASIRLWRRAVDESVAVLLKVTCSLEVTESFAVLRCGVIHVIHITAVLVPVVLFLTYPRKIGLQLPLPLVIQLLTLRRGRAFCYPLAYLAAEVVTVVHAACAGAIALAAYIVQQSLPALAHLGKTLYDICKGTHQFALYALRHLFPSVIAECFTYGGVEFCI